MVLLQKLINFLSSYASNEERVVSNFFNNLTEHSVLPSTRARLLELLQENIAVINLWTEYRYKGYVYLKKQKRRELYTNLERIAVDFDMFYEQSKVKGDAAAEAIRIVAPDAPITKEKATLIYAIMNYFAPERGVYEYRASSSFGLLLQDPASSMLVGDCNQIVTLYIYMYSRYFDIRDLQVRLLPEHVALHYNGVDIEATNATFQNYSNTSGAQLQPIEEIVSINLLDTTDSHFAKHDIRAEDFLQAARFAYILSHDRTIVTHNLDAAYGKLINSLMNNNNYGKALQFAKQSKDMELLGIVGHNGTLYHMGKNEFAAARRFAEYAIKRSELVRDSYHAEGLYHYKAHRYHEAIRSFEKYGDAKLVQSCYEALFIAEQDKLGGSLTTESIKHHAQTIKHMKTYAKKSGNTKMINYANDLMKHL